MISNCGTLTGKVSEFLDYHLKPIMQKGCSYIKDNGSLPENSILVIADVVGLYLAYRMRQDYKHLKRH